MSAHRNNRRVRNLLVNCSIQYRVIIINLFFMALVFFITMAIIYTHLSERESGIEGALRYAMGDLTITLSVKLIVLYILLLVVFLMSIIAQLRMTHRVCGPLVNFCNIFKKIYSGDLFERVQLRKHDLLKKEAAAFNEMVTRISDLVNELKAENERLRDIEK